ncbi:MAG: toxic anion resistance protein [Clostridia bacterium]|nr:toxic anion resistance protein [Clostridia bacterium]MBR6007196.1 toxic anion resistance protein [Clostridia bacterium]
MEQKEKFIPTLTLDPVAEQEAQEAPKPEDNMKTVEELIVATSSLSPEELAAVESFSQKIDITNSAQIMQYGSASQQKLTQFTDGALNAVRTKDLGETGEMITSLIAELKGFNDDTGKKGLFGKLRKKANQIETMKLRYDKAEVNVDRIAGSLEQHQVVLLKDVAMLDQMYERNLDYFKELSMYILAGKKKLETERKVTLPELLAKADKSGLPEDAQKARDFADQCTRFEKKIYDLELTRNISLQMAPQIRLIQNNDTMMAEKIQTSIVNTIPLWKSQMVLALGIAHSQQAIGAQQAVTNMTNELLKKNAETLHMATVEAAKESERGIVDIETLTETNQKLITTMDDVLRIQKEGHEKRLAAEAELTRIEEQLKQKLIEVTGVQPQQ